MSDTAWHGNILKKYSLIQDAKTWHGTSLVTPHKRTCTNLDTAKVEPGMSFANIAGTIFEEDQQRFARFLFRMTRGNTFTNFTKIEEPIVDPKTGKEVSKSVFVIFFQDVKGVQESVMRARILKACVQFGVNTYDWPCRVFVSLGFVLGGFLVLVVFGWDIGGSLWKIGRSFDQFGNSNKKPHGNDFEV